MLFQVHDVEYVYTQIAEITISFDGGATKLNFAEAALLIQGSTCVYSRKVYCHISHLHNVDVYIGLACGTYMHV